ncbi:MAG: hypothetical protein MRERC_3c056 [Mycoplasmataceae bacterium RC_NB112A]|nr:MAG: hypothetical protein MRERC_3c056 [Mycoplasmataceae bacterium RC_NB112A]
MTNKQLVEFQHFRSWGSKIFLERQVVRQNF